MSIPGAPSKRFGRPSSRARLSATRSNGRGAGLVAALAGPDRAGLVGEAVRVDARGRPRAGRRRPASPRRPGGATRAGACADHRSRPLMPLPVGSNAARAVAAEQVADLALGERAARALLDEAQRDDPLAPAGRGRRRRRRRRGAARRSGATSAWIASAVGWQPRQAARTSSGRRAALHVVGAVAVRAERGVEVLAGRAGLAVHAAAVGGEDLRVAGAARRAGQRREPLLRRDLVGAVAVGAPRGARGARSAAA